MFKFFKPFASIVFLNISIGIINSCKPEFDVEPIEKNSFTTISDVKNLDDIKSKFESQDWNKVLKVKLHDSVVLYRLPQWHKAHSIEGRDSSIYTFVPLRTIFKNAKSGKTINNIKGNLDRDYILVKTKESRLYIRFASYSTDQKSKNDNKFSKINRSNFTGILLLKGINNNENRFIEYKDGIRLSVPSQRTANSSSKTQQLEATSQYCEDFWTCYWQTTQCGSFASMVTTIGFGGCDYPDTGLCNGYHQYQTVIEPYCYDDGSGGGYDPDGGYNPPYYPGDGGGSSDSPNNSPTLEEESVFNNAALFGPCPGLNDSWGPLINYVPPTSALTRLSNLTTQQKQAVFGNPLLQAQVTFDPNWQMQSLRNAGGLAINLDRFAVTMTELPIINGNRLTLVQFQEYIRTHFNDFIESGQPHFTPHPAIPGESTNWQNHNIGTIMSIDIADPGSVILSDYSPNHWTFSTIRDPYNDAHPVSGNRTFGVYGSDAYYYTDPIFGWGYSVPASYTFYIMGADRINYRPIEYLGSILNGLSTQPANAFQFGKSDILWGGVTRKIAAFVNDNTPRTNVDRATILTPTRNRPYFTKILEALQNNKPLSGVPCPD